MDKQMNAQTDRLIATLASHVNRAELKLGTAVSPVHCFLDCQSRGQDGRAVPWG